MSAEVSVVIPTLNRPSGLSAVMAGLRAQTLSRERFEVIVVDDGSLPPVGTEGEELRVRVLRHEQARGPGAARNTGWRMATAPLVAFLDDDCWPTERWLEALLRASAAADELTVIQGRIEPRPDQRAQLGPLSHTIEVAAANGLFVSANIAYPRALLEQVGGFDESFRRSAEDVELGARAAKAGARPSFAADALAYHDVRNLSVGELVRHTLKWTDSVRALSLHPELRALLSAGVFWKPTHPRMLIALAGLASRRPTVAALAAVPYLLHYRRLYRGRPEALWRVLPTHIALDACEIATVATASIRYRTVML